MCNHVPEMFGICAVQYELYSSRVRDFEVYGRQSHPRTDGSDYSRHLNSSSWQLIGKFTAGNLKGTQVHRALFLRNAVLL